MIGYQISRLSMKMNKNKLKSFYTTYEHLLISILVTGFVSCVQIFPICSLLLRLDVKKIKKQKSRPWGRRGGGS